MSVTRTKGAWLPAMALALLFCPLARGGQGGSEQKAAEIAAQAKAQFTVGRFRKAAELFEKAYILHRKPSYVFNMGQCYKRLGGLGNLKRAVFYYEAFINTTDSARLAKKVDRRMAKLRQRIKRLEAELHRPTPVYKKWWFWTAVGVVVSGAAVGAAVALAPTDQQPVPGSVEPKFIPLPLRGSTF